MKNIVLFSLLAICCWGCQTTTGEETSESYRDLNGNGKKDIYEDASQSVENRVEDILSQMTVAEKAGLLFNSDAGLVGEPPVAVYQKQIDSLKITHMGMPGLATAKANQELNNTIQKIAEGSRLGIPVTWYTDPRNGLRYNEAAGPNRFHSRWPSDLGIAATRDPELMRELADIGRQEYMALGIRLALHPMADLATEPRWFRIYNTFGEDADLTAKMVEAQVNGFQGESLAEGVPCMTKHFPGGGPQKDGMDAHFATGKEQVYPGGMFDYHLKPFIEGAFKANTSQIMPYYGMPIGITEEEVGFAYNKEIITDLLRDSLGFDGIVCTDWSVVTDNFAKDASAWGVEELSRKERVKKVLDAGCDMFGGESCPGLVVELVTEGSLSEERLDLSARRVLREKFLTGLFDDPYVTEADLAVFENEAYQEKGRIAQQKSLVLLKNEDNMLPLEKNVKVFLSGVDSSAVAAFATVVDDPTAADAIIMKFSPPYTPITEGTLLERIFHEGRVDFPAAQKAEMLSLIRTKPTISIMTLDRVPVIPEINAASKAMIADFSCEDEILAELIFGQFKPSGKLPIEIPSSLAAVEAQLEDVPYDSENPLYKFGFGLTFD